ncbi:DUF4082 domain-containing protein [Actinoplanes sp. M2I2]|uniref:DUF4082 domain-containing protein n=1 Tax=Actinoplanes sp. M2I2 TaxID=1734444 RepID=UPI0020217A72|nr:DUF4082 domain-containing protein [Actinoplanes sp. M2I2]
MITGFRRSRVLTAAAVSLVLTATALAGTAGAAAADCSANPVVCENAETGTSSDEWEVHGAGDGSIQGFATDISADAGETVHFKVRAEHAYTIAIYRLGYYGGAGARRITTLDGAFPAQNEETPCVTDDETQIYDCGTWAESASWPVPATAVSGVYLAKLTRTDDTQRASHITFVVRDDAGQSRVLFKTSDATWQAYNSYGGSNFYGGPGGRATKVSYNRPFATRDAFWGRDFLFSNEYPMIRFLERNGYDVSYTTDVDADRDGDRIADHDIFLSVGHDEYWSGAERASVEAARDAGTHLAFFSGNEVYWRTRWENSKDGAGESHRTLVCYKETWDGTKSDDSSEESTATWRDPRFSPPSQGGGLPENALTGTLFMANSDDLTLAVPAAQGRNRFWRHTDAAGQDAGETLTLAPHTVGYESDEDVDNGFRPAGLIRLSTTTGPTPEYLQDFGKEVKAGTTTHHLTLYRAPSEALVFGAGTVQYAWGLDAEHDSAPGQAEPADERMQQAVVNLFADMGVQPATLMGTLHPATESTDTTGPAVAITSPTATASAANGAKVTVSGTASDTGGGVVAGVEVSLDNGATWHPASGTTTFSYAGNVTGDGAVTVKARATDDSAVTGPVAARTVTLTGSASLFGARVPAVPAAADAAAAELGVKVVPQADGFVKGVRFYKGAGNTGAHVGTLWSADGELMASGTFDDETATGWQTLLFPSPVPVVAGRTYVASYSAPQGRYAAQAWAFAYGAHGASPLTAPIGVHGPIGEFPKESYEKTNYFVDVVYDSLARTAPGVSAVSPKPNARYVPVSAHPAVTFNKAVDASTVQFTVTGAAGPVGGSVAGSAALDPATRKATFVPAAALPAGQKLTVSVTATDTDGNALPEAETWSFHTDPGSTTVASLFAATDVPPQPAVDEAAPVTLGVRFTPQVSGTVSGVRFYKGPGNGGTHSGSLWSSAGSRMTSATFVSESADGWQEVWFATPVKVTAGATYTASYFASRGHYAADDGYFEAARTTGPLSTPAGAGVYAYGSDTFPETSWSGSNYWVDVMFVADPAPTQPVVPAGATTVFAPSATPANPSWNDPDEIEVGLAFTSDVAGRVDGVRFYKGAGNSGPHTATLWSAGGAPITSGGFISESGAGWQTMLFDDPITITAGTQYVVSYSAPNGHYAVDVGGLSAPVVRAPLRSVANGGRYAYGSTFPGTAVGHNYWVDVVFTPAG